MNQHVLSISRRAAVLVGVAGLVVTTTVACSSNGSTPTTATAPGCPVTVTDPWVKAVDQGMTAAFGTLTNTSDTAITIVSASSPAASSMELHEVVDKGGAMVMQPVPGGFEVPAAGSITLEPGGYHLMLMGVTEPIEAGEEVPVTISCSDAATVEFAAPARTFAGGEEEYRNDGMTMDESTAASPMPTPVSS